MRLVSGSGWFGGVVNSDNHSDPCCLKEKVTEQSAASN